MGEYVREWARDSQRARQREWDRERKSGREIVAEKERAKVMQRLHGRKSKKSKDIERKVEIVKARTKESKRERVSRRERDRELSW